MLGGLGRVCSLLSPEAADHSRPGEAAPRFREVALITAYFRLSKNSCRGEHCSPVPVCLAGNRPGKCVATVSWRATNGRPYIRNKAGMQFFDSLHTFKRVPSSRRAPSSRRQSVPRLCPPQSRRRRCRSRQRSSSGHRAAAAKAIPAAAAKEQQPTLPC